MAIDMQWLARTARADIFVLAGDRLLKLFDAGFPQASIMQEAENAALLYRAGVPTPAVLEVTRRNGRLGIVFTRHEACSMLEILVSAPETATATAETFAALHAKIHAVTAHDMPPQREQMRAVIVAARSLSTEVKQAALGILEDLPDDNVCCHGDFHPENVLMTEAGPMVIDWYDATQGSAAADVALTELLLQTAPLPPQLQTRSPGDVETMRKHFLSVYRQRYRQLRAVSDDEVRAWRLPVAVTRLAGIVQADVGRALRAEVDAMVAAGSGS